VSATELRIRAQPLRRALALSTRWLRADVSDVVAIEPARRSGRRAPRERGDTKAGLARWRRRLARRRAVVLLGRNLVVGLVFAVAVEIVIVIAGGRRLSLWLLAPVILVLLAELFGLARRVSLQQAARMLDAGLGLANRVATAIELADATPSTANTIAPAAAEARSVLAARVTEESNAAVQQSLRSAHAVARWSRAESAGLIGTAAVVALLVAIPGLGGQRDRSRGAGSGTPHVAVGRGPGAAHRVTTRRAKTGQSGANRNRIPQITITIPASGSANKLGNGLSGAPYGPGGVAHYSKQLASQGLSTSTAGQGVKSVGTPGGKGGAPSSGTGSASLGSSSAGQSTGGRPTSSGGLSTPNSSSSAPPGATLAGGKGGSSPGHSGSPAGAGGSGAPRSGAAPSGGDSAGRAAGSNKLTAGLVPDLPTGKAGLPLQAGYAPSTSNQSSGNEGISQTAGGGSGAGRSAQANDRGSESGTDFAVIPPTPNSTTTADQGLLYNYFGSADQLRFGNW
jgi:hypothetical protein